MQAIRNVGDQLPAGERKRKLATIQQVATCHKHPNADTLFVVQFSSCLWTSVTRQAYNSGDYVAMFEPDSVFSNTAVASAAGWAPELKYVKPTKLRGILSQVYICPAEFLASWLGYDFGSLLGHDLSDLLGITKYVKQYESAGCRLAGDISPTNLFDLGLVPKTDELRLQSSPWLLKQTCEGAEWYVSAKLDGTSTTYAWYEGKFRCGGRNHFLTDNSNAYAMYANSAKLAQSMAELGKDYAIQGELCGPKIGGNKLGLAKYQFFAFKVWNIAAQQPLPLSEAQTVCAQLRLDFVPILAEYSPDSDCGLIELTALANSLIWGTKPAEGIVVSNKACTSSFKIINDNFR